MTNNCPNLLDLPISQAGEVSTPLLMKLLAILSDVNLTLRSYYWPERKNGRRESLPRGLLRTFESSKRALPPGRIAVV
jgi:hypothetical protein